MLISALKQLVHAMATISRSIGSVQQQTALGGSMMRICCKVWHLLLDGIPDDAAHSNSICRLAIEVAASAQLRCCCLQEICTCSLAMADPFKSCR